MYTDLRYVDSSIASVYEVRYTGVFRNKTAYVSVKIVTDASGPIINDTMTLREVWGKIILTITSLLPVPSTQLNSIFQQPIIFNHFIQPL